VGQLGNKLRN